VSQHFFVVYEARAEGDWERQRKCSQATPLRVLADRGRHNGLSDYLDEVRTLLIPLITGYEGKPTEP
jgi:hypothetical protein